MMESQFIKLTIAAVALLMIPKRSSRNADHTNAYHKPSTHQGKDKVDPDVLNDKYNQ